MHMQFLRLRALAFVAGVAVLVISGWANADPPSRVARLGYMTGAVSFSPAGENDWIQATINRPLTTGDRLWTDAGARAEIQVGGAMIRMHAGTGVSILNLDDRIAQLQLTQGTLNVRVRRLAPNQVFEVDTPNLAFTLRQPGEYRIEVDTDGNATTIVVRKGQGDVYGENAAYVIDSRQPYRFTGTGLREYEYVDAPRIDDFDRWSGDRDRSYDNSASARYVSQDVVGYQDLDANGTWRADATYGNVWIPNRVAAGWAPYRDGHWAWVDPWGWTWVDDSPWGFAVSHYGRWNNFGGTWGWVPGPVRARAYYAPALVAFVGGSNFVLTIGSGNVGGVAWFPLGPRDVYRPSYAASRGYFENINRSNTVINTTVINNYNNTNVTNVVYANQQVPGAVVAVPTTAFVQSQPVARAAVQVSRDMIASRPVAFVPSAAPTERSVRGAAAQGDKPPPRVFERPVVARTAPPVAAVGFAAQQQQLTAKPGRPLDDAARKELRPAAAAPAPQVRVIAQKQEAPPTMRPPSAAPGASPVDARGRSEAPAISGAPSPPMQRAAPAQAMPPAPAAQPPEQRGQREQRGQPVAPPPTPQGAQPQRAPPQAMPPVPAAAQPASPPPPSQRAAEPKALPPQVAPAPMTQPPPQRSAQPAMAPTAPMTQPPPQRSAQPAMAPTAPMTQPPPQRSAQPAMAPTAPMTQPPPQRSAQPAMAPTAPMTQPPPQRSAQPAMAPTAPMTQPPPQRSAQPAMAPTAPMTQPPPQRSAQPAMAPTAPMTQPPPQRSAQPAMAPPPQAAPPRPPVAAPGAPPPQPPPAAKAAPRGQEPAPPTGK